MSSDGVQEVLASFDAFNAHDLDGAVDPLAEECAWTEHPTGITHQGTQQVKDWFAGFWAGFPDLAVSELTAYDQHSLLAQLGHA